MRSAEEFIDGIAQEMVAINQLELRRNAVVNYILDEIGEDTEDIKFEVGTTYVVTGPNTSNTADLHECRLQIANVLVLEDHLVETGNESEAELNEIYSNSEMESSFEYHTDQSNFV